MIYIIISEVMQRIITYITKEVEALAVDVANVSLVDLCSYSQIMGIIGVLDGSEQCCLKACLL